MSRPAQTLRELARVRAENPDVLARFPRTALGRKNFTAQGVPDGKPCIIVYVAEKEPEARLSAEQRVPRVLSTRDEALYAHTDVVEFDPAATAAPFSPDVLDPGNAALCARLRWSGEPEPVKPGFRIGYGRRVAGRLGNYSGTVACVAVDARGRRGLLTNQHVGDMPGMSLYRPYFRRGAGRVAMVRDLLLAVADERWIEGVDEPDAFGIVDASCAPLRRGVAAENRLPDGRALGPVVPLSLDSMAPIGQPVHKVGYRTGHQLGTILAVGATRPDYAGAVDEEIGHSAARFYADLVIGPRAPSTFLSAPGDSGSLIYVEDGGVPRPIGMLWGGSAGDVGREAGVEQLSFATHLDGLLRVMGLTLPR